MLPSTIAYTPTYSTDPSSQSTRADVVPTALVIDPDPDMRFIVSRLLESLDYDVMSASTPDDGCALAKAWPPNLVVTEMRCTLGDHDLIPARLRRLPKLHRAALIVCSSWCLPDDAERAYELGADLFMNMPFDFGAIRRFAAELVHHDARTALKQVPRKEPAARLPWRHLTSIPAAPLPRST